MTTSPVHALSPDDSWQHLRETQLGRLATAALGAISIVPVNYVVDGETIVFRTATGSKLIELAVNRAVAFEIDDYGSGEAWSVVVNGSATIISDADTIAAVELLPLSPWTRTIKPTFVRITPTAVSGRRFELDMELSYEDTGAVPA